MADEKLPNTSPEGYLPESSQGGEQANLPQLPEDILELKRKIKAGEPLETPAVELPAEKPKFYSKGTLPREPEVEVEKPRRRGFGETFTGAAKRGALDLAATPLQLKGIAEEAAGYDAEAEQSFARATAIERLAPKPTINGFDDIYDAEDAALWATETLGEFSPQLIALLSGAGTGAALGTLIGKGFFSSAIKRKAATRIGMHAGGIATGVGLETGATGRELKTATGSYQPGTAATAGAVKGLLEWYTPYRFAKAFETRGVPLPSVAQAAGAEAATEGLQELVDATARAYEDQNYEFWSRSTGLRIAEAAVAGGLVGGVLRGGAELISQPNMTATEDEVQEQLNKTRTGDLDRNRAYNTGSVKKLAPYDAESIGERAKDKNAALPSEKAANDLDLATPYDRANFKQKWKEKVKKTGELFAAEEDIPGLRFEGGVNRIGQGNYKVFIGDKEIGEAYVRTAGPGKAQIGRISIATEYQRKGIGSKLWDHIAQDMGKELIPDSFLTEAGYALNKKKLGAEALRNHKRSKEGGPWLEDPYGDLLRVASSDPPLDLKGGLAQTQARWSNPLTWLRRKAKAVHAVDDMVLAEGTRPVPLEDYSELSSLLTGVRKTWEVNGAAAQNLELIREFEDAQTPRYITRGQDGVWSGILNRLDMNEFVARQPQSFKPQVYQVDLRSMNAASITADFEDLNTEDKSTPGDRLLFLPHVDANIQANLRQRFESLRGNVKAIVAQRSRMGAAQYQNWREQLMEEYATLVEEGLRVIPSYGASFIYQDKVDGKPVKNWLISNRLPVREASINSILIRDDYGSDTLSYKVETINPDKVKFHHGYTTVSLKGLDTLSQLVAKGVKDIHKYFWFRDPNLSQAEKEALALDYIKDVQDKGSAEFHRLGIQAKPHYTNLIDGFFPFRELPPEVLTPYVNVPDRFKRETTPPHTPIPQQMEMQLVQVATPGFTFLDKLLDKMAPVARQVVSGFDEVLKEFGLPRHYKVILSPVSVHGLTSEPSPYYMPTDNTIVFPATMFEPGKLDPLFLTPLQQTQRPEDIDITSMRAAFHHILAHEYGHLLHYTKWNNLPLTTQMRVYSAYEKARLAAGIEGRSYKTLQAVKELQAVSSEYTLSFAEFMAEQFRRWALTNTRALTTSEKYFKEAGETIKKYDEVWATTLTPTQRQDMMYPSWEFSQMMEYLQEASFPSDTTGMRLKELAAVLPDEGRIPIGLERAAEETRKALEEFRLILRAGTQLEINQGTNKPDVNSTIYGSYNTTSSVLRLWLGSLALSSDVNLPRKVVAEEAAHSVWQYLTDAEKKLVVEAGKRETRLTPARLALYNRLYRNAKDGEGNPLYTPDEVQDMIDQEYFAALMVSRMNGGSHGTRLNKILDALIELVERIRNLLSGSGFNSANQVARAFYRGELASRDREANAQQAVNEIFYDFYTKNSQTILAASPWDQVTREDLLAEMSSSGIDFNTEADVRLEVADGVVAVAQYVGGDKVDKRSLDAVTYRFFDTKTMDKFGVEMPIGFVALINRPDVGAFEVEMVEVFERYRKQGYSDVFYRFISEQLDQRMRASGSLTTFGYDMWRRRDPHFVRYHVYDEKAGMWFSPKQIVRQLNHWKLIQTRESLPGSRNTGWGSKEGLQKTIDHYKMLKKKVNPEAWKDAEYPESFAAVARTERELYWIKKERDLNENRLLNALDGEQRETDDLFSASFDEKWQSSKSENSWTLGIPFDQAAPRQVETEVMRKIFDGVYPRGERDPEINKELVGLSAEADRISWFSKMFLGIQQVAWRNSANQGLRPLHNYVSLVQDSNTFRMAMVTRADNLAKRWDEFPEDQRVGLANMLFWLTEMNYRTPQEVVMKVTRMPTQSEYMAQAKKYGLTTETIQLQREIATHFDDFLKELEVIVLDKINRSFVNNPTGRQAAINKLKAQMVEMRKKPYFPLVRFGDWTITGRDGDGQVQWFSAYPTAKERDAALKKVVANNIGLEFQIGLAPQELKEFQGLPAPLIDMILDTDTGLPGITPAQRYWLEQFKFANSPENSFKKRWLQRQGTPGYSQDALRAFSHYFVTGSGYLAKLKYKEQMRGEIDALRQTLPKLRDTRKRVKLLDMMESHFRYIMEPQKEFTKTKSLISLWQLGFSPMAAAMNLTQTVNVSLPYFEGVYGNGQGLKAALRATRGMHKMTYNPVHSSREAYLAAKQELGRQGKLVVGQAPELGAFAEGATLNALTAGTDAQKAFRKATQLGMFMFGEMERINREIAFAMSWDLALDRKNQNNKTLLDLELKYLPEINRLMQETYDVGGVKVNLTYDQALAVVAAREAIDRTQFVFAPWARPKFLQNKYTSVFLVFFGFVQAMVFAMGNNPGAIKMILIFAFMYGLSGLPGAEDLNEIIAAIMRRLYGKDYKPKEEVREFINAITRDGPFEKIGSDLALHGVSRYGFGLGLLDESWGVPRFDASGNGSLGRLVPGLAEAARGIGTASDWKTISANLARDTSGAGISQLFALLQFLQSDPMTADQKKWESIMPRAAKAVSKALRYYDEEMEKTPQGGEFVRFDPLDPSTFPTIVGQALGATPTDINQMWEYVRLKQERVEWYNNRRSAILGQLYNSVISKNKEGLAEARGKIVKFNLEMRDLGPGYRAFVMTPDVVKRSMEARLKRKGLQDAGFDGEKRFIPLGRQMLEQFPAIEQRKVK